MKKKTLSQIGANIIDMISSRDFYSDGMGINAMERKTRELIALYEMHIQAHGEDYKTTPLLKIMAVEYVKEAMCVASLIAAHRLITLDSMSIEHEVQLKNIIKATIKEANSTLNNLKREMIFQESPRD